jgi:hypothetical protein
MIFVITTVEIVLEVEECYKTLYQSHCFNPRTQQFTDNYLSCCAVEVRAIFDMSNAKLRG